MNSLRDGIHPAANLFPMMGPEELKKLTADIKEHGQREPLRYIRMIDGRHLLIDGRNREKAMLSLGIAHEDMDCLTEAEGDFGDPISFVLSLNLHRRHLNEGQLGLIAEKVANLRNGTNQHQKKEGGTIVLPSETSSKTISAAAAEVGVSGKTVQRAKRVKATAVPDIVSAVEAGTLSLSAAAEVAKLDKTQQQTLVNIGPAAVKAEAAKLRKRTKPPKTSAEEEQPKQPGKLPKPTSYVNQAKQFWNTIPTDVRRSIEHFWKSIPDGIALEAVIALIREKREV